MCGCGSLRWGCWCIFDEHAWIYGPLPEEEGSDPEPVEVAEMKVKVPAIMHIKLHGLKVLTGQSISKSVQEALWLYFEKREARSK